MQAWIRQQNFDPRAGRWIAPENAIQVLFQESDHTRLRCIGFATGG
jgi:hypothetical protein